MGRSRTMYKRKKNNKKTEWLLKVVKWPIYTGNWRRLCISNKSIELNICCLLLTKTVSRKKLKVQNYKKKIIFDA